MTHDAGPGRPRGPAHPGGGRLLAALLFGALALAPVAAGFGPEGYILSLLTRVMIFALAALSLDLVLGHGGLVSFGHAAFLGIGAYAVGILASHGVDDLLVQTAAALAASALFGLLTGAVSLRTRGVYFIMITLAFGQMAFFFATALTAYGGDDGLTLPARSRVFGADALAHGRVFYYATLACLVGAYVLCRALVASRFGRVLRASRENPVRVEAVGLDRFAYQLTAYVIAGMMCGLAGVLLANQAEFVSPAYMTWQRSGDLIVMTVLGGLATGPGAIVGAASVLLLEEFLSEATEHWRMIFGPLLVVVALRGRGGLLGLLGRRHG